MNNYFSEYAIWLLIALVISVFSKTPIRAAINVFLFFLAMTISYHMYTVLFSGFNPKKYMMIWYSLTILSPVLGFISWYAKSSNKLTIIINSLIIYVMLSVCFDIGMWYFDFRNILYTLTFILTLIILFKDIKVLSISFIIGLILAFIIRFPYVY